MYLNLIHTTHTHTHTHTYTQDEGADSTTTCGYMTVGDDALGELTLTDSATVGPTNTSDTQVVRLTDTRAGVCFRDLLTGLPHCAEVDVDTDLLLSSGPGTVVATSLRRYHSPMHNEPLP